MRVISHETEIVVEAVNDEAAKYEAYRRAPFLIWDHRNAAEYDAVTIKEVKDSN